MWEDGLNHVDDGYPRWGEAVSEKWVAPNISHCDWCRAERDGEHEGPHHGSDGADSEDGRAIVSAATICAMQLRARGCT